ncbi:MAG: DUF547 domain-containing protein [Planctomycetota bacterium]|jgi:hypothetical protein
MDARTGARGPAAALALAVGLAAPPGAARAADDGPFDRGLYAELLERHTRSVSDVARVRVDYRALAGSAEWRRLVVSLAAAKPQALATRDERMSFWIDVYNILAMDLVARNLPLESIRDLGSFLRPVWKREAGRVGGRAVTLHEIEHEILRPMGDPRIHAAIVCASTSCPSLRREPWSPASLDTELDAAVRRFLADRDKGLRIDRDAGTVHLSKIFDWFEEDFETSGGVLAFVGRHAPAAAREWLTHRADDPALRFMHYDWRLNAIDGGGS